MKTLGIVWDDSSLLRDEGNYLVEMTHEEHSVLINLQYMLEGRCSVDGSKLRKLNGDLGKALVAILNWTNAKFRLADLKEAVVDIEKALGNTEASS